MKQHDRLIMGKNCINELLRNDPKRIIKVFTEKTNTQDPFYKELVKSGVSIQHVSKQDLFQLVNSTSHQSYIASVKPRGCINIHEFLEDLSPEQTCLVLMLDSIFDPHNFGAILRTAECFGVDCVVYSKNRGADVTPVVSKVSSGASELIPLAKVSNLAETAKLFQDQGFSIMAADVGEGARSIYQFAYPKKTLLILGSEGEGVQNLLKKRSDFILKIPMEGNIDSLNVSQAAAVFLYAYRMQFPRQPASQD